MGLRMKNYGGSLKNPIFRGVHEKPIHRRELPKKGMLGQFVDLQGDPNAHYDALYDEICFKYTHDHGIREFYDCLEKFTCLNLPISL